MDSSDPAIGNSLSGAAKLQNMLILTNTSILDKYWI